MPERDVVGFLRSHAGREIAAIPRCHARARCRRSLGMMSRACEITGPVRDLTVDRESTAKSCDFRELARRESRADGARIAAPPARRDDG